MAKLPKEIQHVSELFNSFPGIGPKLSHRLSLYTAVKGKGHAQRLARALDELVEKITLCSICGNVTIGEVCDICDDEKRDKSVLMVVEDSLDLFNIEETGEYDGVYHVLQGIISPLNGVTPEDLTIDLLNNRIKDNNVQEIIVALNPTVEGDATSMYLQKNLLQIRDDLKITRLAKGIPSGSDLEFISPQTIADSLRRRDEL